MLLPVILPRAVRPQRLISVWVLSILAGSLFGQQEYFGIGHLEVGRLQLDKLQVNDVKLGKGTAVQGVYRQPVTFWLESGTIALRSTDNKNVLFHGKIAAGSTFAAVFECDGGPCLAPKKLSVNSDGLALTVTLDQSSLPPLLGGSVKLVGSTVKLIGSQHLEIASDKSQGLISLRFPIFTVRGFGFRPSEESDPLTMDISSQGTSIVTLDLEHDALEIQKAKFVKTGFVSDKPYRVTLESQTATGTQSTAGTITIDITSKSGSAANAPAINTVIEVKDWSLKAPKVTLEKYPDFQVTGVSEITVRSIQGDLITQPVGSVLLNPKIKELVAQPDPFQVVGTLNAISQGKSILPTGSANVRYISAQSLKMLYQTLGIAEDDRTMGHTVYLPVKDGVIYDIQPGTFPIDDPGTKDPPILVEGVGMVAGHFAGEAGSELLGELLAKPIRDAALGASLNGMLLHPSLGMPTAWIVYNGGTYLAGKPGEIPDHMAGKAVEIIEDVLVEPVLHTMDPDLAAELVKYLEVPPPVLPPTSVNIKDDNTRALAIRKERIKFISDDALKPSARRNLPPAARAKLEAYERLLEWAVNQRYSFRQDVKARIEPAWKDRQATKVNTFLKGPNGSDAVEEQRRQIVNLANALNAQESLQQEKANDQQKIDGTNQMQSQMDSQMSGFSGGIGLSFGESANRAPTLGGPLTGSPVTSHPGGPSEDSGTGCSDMYQSCFQKPVYINFSHLKR